MSSYVAISTHSPFWQKLDLFHVSDGVCIASNVQDCGVHGHPLEQKATGSRGYRPTLASYAVSRARIMAMLAVGSADKPRSTRKVALYVSISLASSR